MKTLIPLGFSAALALAAVSVGTADDTPVSTVPVNTVPRGGIEATTAGPRKATPMLRDEHGLSGNKGGFGRVFEARAGSRFSMVYGSIRPGGNGSSELDFRKDLDLRDVEIGPQIDVEWQISPKSHFQLSYAHNDFSRRISTKEQYQYQGMFSTQQNPVFLPPGSTVNNSVDMDLFWGHFRYDLVREGPLTVSPLVGFKAVFLDEESNIASAQPGITPFTSRTSLSEATPLLGCDLRLQFTRWCYLGLVPYGFAFDRWAYLGGQGFLQFDFTPNFGLRLGMDVDYVSAKRVDSNNFSVNGAVGSAFVQAVAGF